MTNILNRLLVVLCLLTVTVPLAASAVIFSRSDAEQGIGEALDEAKDGYRRSANIAQDQRVNQRVLQDAQRRIKDFAKRERQIRLRLRAIYGTMANVQNRTDQLILSEERATQLMASQKDRLAEFVRGAYMHLALSERPRGARLLTRRLFDVSLGQSVDEDLRQEALTRASQQLVRALLQTRESATLSQEKLHAAAGSLGEELFALQDEREQLLKQYAAAMREKDSAEGNLTLSAEQLADVQRETQAVQQEILRMQGELARIDARLRTKAERELIQMGLRDARPGRYNQPTAPSDGFAWPAQGRVSAGFGDVTYRKFFGVPHQGIDIVIPQNSAVYSAADGIVFLARDGGLRGFSYILIGHRDGYATLYGHLSSFSVSTGQQVSKGQLIGLSGGAPGTHGAGPMTTGSHLHFEVMKNGAHINPREVLP